MRAKGGGFLPISFFIVNFAQFCWQLRRFFPEFTIFHVFLVTFIPIDNQLPVIAGV